MLATGIDWTQVTLAGIGAVVAIANGLGIAVLYTHLRTPSKTTIGKQVEDALHTVIANNYRLQAMGDEFDVPMPAKASATESKVEALNEVKTRAQRRPHG